MTSRCLLYHERTLANVSNSNMSASPQRRRFGQFDVDFSTGELRKHGLRVSIPEQPLSILRALLEQPGEIVTREDLKERLWASETFVDFERSLNAAVAKLRRTLSDSAEQPRYIETVARRGYRFIAPVETADSTPGGGDSIVPEGNGWAAKSNRERLFWLTGVVALAALALAEPYFLKPPRPESGSIRFVLSPPEGTRIHPGSAVSPDGSRLAFVAFDRSGARALWVRPAGAETMQRLENTEGALLPFWSPDSQHIGFFANGKVKVIPASGGSPRILCDERYPEGGTWNRDGVILFSQSRNLYRVSVAGGAPVPIMQLNSGRGGIAQTWPQFLPDGRRFIFFAEISEGSDRTSRSGVYLASLDSPELRFLMATRHRAAFAAPDYLLFVRNGSLLAQKLDLNRGLISGEPVHIADNATVHLEGVSTGGGAAAFSVSDNGVLLYHSGSPLKSQLVWYGRSGKRLGNVGEPREYTQIRLAPDDRHAIVGIKNTEMDDGENWSLWLLDTETNLFSRLTFSDGRDADPVWSPNSRKVVYGAFSRKDQRVDLMEITIGHNAPVLFYRDAHSNKPDAWSPDGRFILYRRDERVVLTLTTDADRKSAILFDTPYMIGAFRFSPDSRRLAYAFKESVVRGQQDTSSSHEMGEIFVTDFPDLTGTRRISTSGGCAPSGEGMVRSCSI